MKIETFNKEGKIIETKKLDYKTGMWETFDSASKLKAGHKMSQFEIEEFNETQRKLRENDLRQEADTLFFKSEAGEIDKQTWISKRKEIRERYPYIEI